jgi:N-acetyl-anhydromuramyl-L-alanine amidase AmpD
LGYDLIVDAHFGKKTLSALQSFQKKHGLVVDGIAGPKTMATLESIQKNKTQHNNPNLTNINYGSLEVIKTEKLPDFQYVKQITPKKQIFLHFTAGSSDAKTTTNYWNSDLSKVATAYVIDGKTGLPYEMFHPDYFGWHLGIKKTNGKLDKASIGIEICSYGPLKKKGDKFYAWPKDFSSVIVSPENVYVLDKPFRNHIYYYKFTDKQIESLEKLLVVLIDSYNIKVQNSFDINWFEYNSDVITKCLPGIWSHTTVRKDKFDIYPDHRVLEVLNNIAKKYNKNGQ